MEVLQYFTAPGEPDSISPVFDCPAEPVRPRVLIAAQVQPGAACLIRAMSQFVFFDGLTSPYR